MNPQTRSRINEIKYAPLLKHWESIKLAILLIVVIAFVIFLIIEMNNALLARDMVLFAQ